MNAAAVAYLAEGETLRRDLHGHASTDVNGPHRQRHGSVTITGTNDAPVIAGELFTGGVTEAGSNADTGTLTTSDSFSFDDADLTDTHSVGVHPGRRDARHAEPSDHRPRRPAPATAPCRWTYSVNAADVAYLAEGETLVESFTVTVTDDHRRSPTAPRSRSRSRAPTTRRSSLATPSRAASPRPAPTPTPARSPPATASASTTPTSPTPTRSAFTPVGARSAR